MQRHPTGVYVAGWSPDCGELPEGVNLRNVLVRLGVRLFGYSSSGLGAIVWSCSAERSTGRFAVSHVERGAERVAVMAAAGSAKQSTATRSNYGHPAGKAHMLKNAQVSVDGDRVEVVHSVELAGSELTVMLAFTEAEARAYLATIGAAVDQLAGVRPTRDRLVVPANDHYDGGPFIRSI